MQKYWAPEIRQCDLTQQRKSLAKLNSRRGCYYFKVALQNFTL